MAENRSLILVVPLQHPPIFNRMGALGRDLSRVITAWPERYGRNLIEPVNGRDDVSDYCAKYVCKEGAWWNVKLLGQRHPLLVAKFVLDWRQLDFAT